MNTPLQAEIGAALRAVIDEMAAASTQLLLVLEEEREALNQADAEALNRSGEAKQMLMRRLEQLDAERLQMSASLPGAAPHNQSQWTEVLQSLAQCRDRNLRNGELVGQRLSQVRRALSALTGQETGPATYGRRGSVNQHHRSVPLAEA